MKAEELFVVALQQYRNTKNILLSMWIANILAEIYLLTGKISEADSTILSIIELSSMNTAAGVYRVQGKICVAKQELVQAAAKSHIDSGTSPAAEILLTLTLLWESSLVYCITKLAQDSEEIDIFSYY